MCMEFSKLDFRGLCVFCACACVCVCVCVCVCLYVCVNAQCWKSSIVLYVHSVCGMRLSVMCVCVRDVCHVCSFYMCIVYVCYVCGLCSMCVSMLCYLCVV